MAKQKDRFLKTNFKRMMQALGLMYIFLFFPVCTLFVSWTERSGDPLGTETEMIQSEKTEKPRIALTFDDGPDSTYTPLLLEGLKDRNVKASFFLIGINIEKDRNREIVRQIYEDGHLIGNHTYHHVELARLSETEARMEIAKTNRLITEITGTATEYVRPPFGSFNRNMEKETDWIPVMWTVDPLDWQTDNTEEIVNKVVTDVQENDIILLHDCYKSSVDAALQIVDRLKEEGFEFVTVDELLLD